MKKNKKRIMFIAAVMCLVIAATPVSALAVSGSEEGTVGSTVVTYIASPTYTIEIPSAFTLPASGDGRISISCTENNMGVGTFVNVMLDAQNTFNSDGNFYLVNTEDDSMVIKCTLATDGYPLSTSGGAICQYRDGSTESSLYDALIIHRVDTAPSAGTYTGTIYFTIGVTRS